MKSKSIHLALLTIIQFSSPSLSSLSTLPYTLPNLCQLTMSITQPLINHTKKPSQPITRHYSSISFRYHTRRLLIHSAAPPDLKRSRLAPSGLVYLNSRSLCLSELNSVHTLTRLHAPLLSVALKSYDIGSRGSAEFTES